MKRATAKTTVGLKVDMDFDEFMRRLVRVKPPKKSAKRKK
jgi:hypothetical protein